MGWCINRFMDPKNLKNLMRLDPVRQFILMTGTA